MIFGLYIREVCEVGKSIFLMYNKGHAIDLKNDNDKQRKMSLKN